jgi:type I restriction enzyme S subunit
VISRNSINGAYPIKRLGEVVEFLDSKRRPVTESDRRAGPYPYYGANGIQGTIDEFIFDEPLVLLAEDGGHFGEPDRGIAYRISGKTWVNNHAHVLRPTSVIDLAYLCRVLENYDVTPFVTGTTRGKLTKAGASEIIIPLPPLAEQRRIAEVLDRAEALRAKRRAALAQLDSLTQTLFLDLFGDPRPNTKSWPVKSLKELGKVKTGGTPPGAKPGMFGGTIPFVTPGDLESDEPVKRTVTEEGAAEAETVRAGSTLVCCIGATIGKMGRAAQRSAFNQQLNAVEWANGLDDDYGLGVLRFFKPQIATWGASTTLPILKKSSFEKIEIPVPPITLQREFARRVTAVEALKTAHRASLAELDALFASLQHRAFKGEL